MSRKKAAFQSSLLVPRTDGPKTSLIKDMQKLLLHTIQFLQLQKHLKMR
jgi:hypothetical protein